MPDRVQLTYRLANGRGSGTVLCSKIGERQFRHSLSGLLEDVEFHIYGGDFVNREPYRVQIVEPPQLDEIDLACFYPAYTGMKAPDSTPDNPIRDVVPVRGTQVELPNETDFLLRATANKPIVRVRLQFGDHELVFARRGDEVRADYIERDEEGQQEVGVSSVPRDRTTIDALFYFHSTVIQSQDSNNNNNNNSNDDDDVIVDNDLVAIRINDLYSATNDDDTGQ